MFRDDKIGHTPVTSTNKREKSKDEASFKDLFKMIIKQHLVSNPRSCKFSISVVGKYAN